MEDKASVTQAWDQASRFLSHEKRFDLPPWAQGDVVMSSLDIFKASEEKRRKTNRFVDDRAEESDCDASVNGSTDSNAISEASISLSSSSVDEE